MYFFHFVTMIILSHDLTNLLFYIIYSATMVGTSLAAVVVVGALVFVLVSLYNTREGNLTFK